MPSGERTPPPIARGRIASTLGWRDVDTSSRG
jgi:hypothetical protein